jgi:FG-GAP repeat
MGNGTLDCIINVMHNDSQNSKKNSNIIQKRDHYAENRKKSVFHPKLFLDQSLKNYFTILLGFFCIVMPLGLESQQITNYAFGQSDFRSQNEEVENSDEGDNLSSASIPSSEFRTKQNLKDPFDSDDNNIKSVNENIMIPDVIGPEHPDTRTSSGANSSASSQPQSELESQTNFQSQYESPKGYVESNNSGGQSIIETYDENGTVLGTDAQVGTVHINTDNNTNEKATGSANHSNTFINQSGSSNSSEFESQSTTQPRYKSYRDYIEHTKSNNEQKVIETDDKPSVELNSTDSQTGTGKSIDNANRNINNLTIKIPEEKSSTELSSTLSPSSQISAQSSIKIYGDFNGDGFDDLAIGVPFEDVISAEDDAGAVNVIYGSSNGLSATSPMTDQFWAQSTTNVDDSSETNDNFGSSLTSGDFNGDGRDDLAIGVPGENNGAGGVNVLYGSSSGLSATSPRADQFWTQNTADVNDASETGDSFGRSLTSGDFNADGKDDLTIGVPSEDVGGGVEVIYGSSSGLSATSPRADQFWTQNTADVNDASETGDSFGRSLTSGDFNADGKDDLAIGVPDEDLSVDLGQAGAVEVIYGSSSGLSATSPRADQFWTQDSANVDGVAEHNDAFGFSVTSGDFNGDGRDDLAIGARWENINSLNEAGAVQVIYGSSSGLSATSPRSDQFWTQDTTNINDIAESEDQFGYSLSSGDFNDDGKDDLAIGVWWEDVDIGGGNVDDAGGVEVIYGSSSGLSATSPRSDQFWTQDSADINDVPERPDEFGLAVYSGDFNGDGKDDLAIGVPQEDVGSIESAGGVEVIYGSSSGLSATSPRADQFWTQSTADVNDASETGDEFGTALG